MGHKRQVSRAKRHANGEFFEKKLMLELQKKRQAFNFKVYLRDRQSDAVFSIRVYGTTTVAQRRESIARRHPRFRVVAVKKSPSLRWVKPEHPIAMRRRLKQERIAAMCGGH